MFYDESMWKFEVTRDLECAAKAASDLSVIALYVPGSTKPLEDAVRFQRIGYRLNAAAAAITRNRIRVFRAAPKAIRAEAEAARQELVDFLDEVIQRDRAETKLEASG